MTSLKGDLFLNGLTKRSPKNSCGKWSFAINQPNRCKYNKESLARMVARHANPGMREMMRNNILEAHRRMYNATSLCCFTTAVKEQRVWATYADGGAGYGLVFDFRHRWELQAMAGHPSIPMVPFHVHYVEERPILPLSFTSRSPERSVERSDWRGSF